MCFICANAWFQLCCPDAVLCANRPTTCWGFATGSSLCYSLISSSLSACLGMGNGEVMGKYLKGSALVECSISLVAVVGRLCADNFRTAYWLIHTLLLSAWLCTGVVTSGPHTCLQALTIVGLYHCWHVLLWDVCSLPVPCFVAFAAWSRLIESAGMHVSYIFCGI